MNKLVKVTKTKVWSEWCKNILGKYCVFKTADGKNVCGFVTEYSETCEPIKIRDFYEMKIAEIRPIDIAPGMDCERYDLEYGVLENKPKIKDTMDQCYLITEKETYTFECIEPKRIYSFIDKKSGCIVFLTFSDATKDKATVRMACGFCEKEFTAKEFAEAFDDDNGDTFCGCPCDDEMEILPVKYTWDLYMKKRECCGCPPSCVDDTFDFFTAMSYMKEGRKVRRVDWTKGEYISINKREDGYVVENESGIKISTLEFSPFESNWELYSEE